MTTTTSGSGRYSRQEIESAKAQETSKTGLLSKSQIIERGWTASMIEKLLGEPDELRNNPRYKSAPPMRLYELVRVVEAEGTEQYKYFRSCADKRRAAIQPTIDSRRNETLELVETAVNNFNLPVSITRFTYAQLKKGAIQEKVEFANYQAESRGTGEHYTADYFADAEASHIKRWIANYIRHHRSVAYDELLERIAKKIGRGDAYIRLKEGLNEKINKYIAELERGHCE